MSKNFKTGILVLLIFALGGYIIWGNEKTLHPAPAAPAVTTAPTASVVPPDTNAPDLANPDMMLFTSKRLGVELVYPKMLTGGGNFTLPNPVPIVVSTSGNRLTVAADREGSYYAEMYQKNPDETFEQSILRQFVDPQYQNNPCTVTSAVANEYRITFPGDSMGADAMSATGEANAKKCWSEPDLMWHKPFVADPLSNGFYIATAGIQEPTFGTGSTGWWPKNIRFLSDAVGYTEVKDQLGYFDMTLPPGWRVVSTAAPDGCVSCGDETMILSNGTPVTRDNQVQVSLFKDADKGTEAIKNFLAKKPLGKDGIDVYLDSGGTWNYTTYLDGNGKYAFVDPASGATLLVLGNAQQYLDLEKMRWALHFDM